MVKMKSIALRTDFIVRIKVDRCVLEKQLIPGYEIYGDNLRLSYIADEIKIIIERMVT